MLVRLQKYLADRGVASRRKSEELIACGRVSVNGVVVTEMGYKIDDESDVVLLNGKPVKHREELVYFMLHKPEEYVTTSDEQFGRPAVLDLMKDVKQRVYPVGRLDYDTSGLLIITNDGELTYRLTHPKFELDKSYIARLGGVPPEAELERFRKGLQIEDYTTAPAKIEIIKNEGKTCSVKIVLHEGRNRQIRKMCDAIGASVKSLKRVATGNIFLGNLSKGKYRPLTNHEIRYLKEQK